MPDFNKFGRALADQAQNVSRGTAGKIADATGADPTVDVAGEVGRLRGLVNQMRPAPRPVTGRWSLGFGDVLASHPATPSALRGIVGKLDRYGGLGIGEQALSVDGNEVPWSAVTEVRTQSFVEYLLSGALQEQVRTIPVPWFPGRKKVLEAISKALLTVLFAAAHDQLNLHEDVRVPAEIRYRAGTRERSMSPGVMATLLLADPAVSQCLFATAAQRGVTVFDDSPPWSASVEQRAGQLRGRLAGLESKLGQWRLDADDPEPSADESSPQPPQTSPPPRPPESSPPPQPPNTPDLGRAPAALKGASSAADPHQPLFPSSNDDAGADSGPVGYPQIGSPVGYPQIGAVATRHAAGGDDGVATANRQIPQSWIFAGAAVLVVAALIVGVLVFVGSSDSEQASSSRQIDSSGPSDTSDSSGGSDPRQSDSTGGTASNYLSFDRMRDFTYMHYADLPSNPSATWSRFDPKLANKVGWRGYVDFWNTIASVTVVSVMPRDANSVVVRLKYLTRNGSTDTEDRSLSFVTSDGELRIFDSERIGSVG